MGKVIILIIACEDKPWCTNFPYCKDSQQLRERISKDCPIECKELRCQKYWKDDSSEMTTTAKNPPPRGTTTECILSLYIPSRKYVVLAPIFSSKIDIVGN